MSLNIKETEGVGFMLGWIETLVRTTILFFLSLIIVRVLGKRHPLKMTPFTFITYTVLAIIGAMISVGIIENYVFGIISLLSWGLLFIAVDYASMKSKMVHDLIYGKESILIKDGKVMEENLAKERLSGEELLRALRSKNAFNLADVEFAIMEPTGDINVVLKADKKPVTPYDLEQKVAPATAPQTVILDGSIVRESLSNLGLSEAWLQTQLDATGVSIDNVFIGQVDSSGDLFLDLFDDATTPPQSQVKQLLYANLEKCHADLYSFSLETNDEKAKEMFFKDAERIQNIMDKLRPYLLR
jgi:uncharacterized membrane protein YcaP (DUF421 family)